MAASALRQPPIRVFPLLENIVRDVVEQSAANGVVARLKNELTLTKGGFEHVANSQADRRQDRQGKDNGRRISVGNDGQLRHLDFLIGKWAKQKSGREPFWQSRSSFTTDLPPPAPRDEPHFLA